MVTYKRRPILLENIDILWLAIDRAKSPAEFEIIAWVINPDHFHLILNPMQNNLSKLVKRIKLSFSMNYQKRKGLKKGRVWQYRFWDHIIRSEDDLNRHIDYVHYNPIKHRLTKNPLEYEHSSLGEFGEFYSRDWGTEEEIEFTGDYGE